MKQLASTLRYAVAPPIVLLIDQVTVKIRNMTSIPSYHQNIGKHRAGLPLLLALDTSNVHKYTGIALLSKRWLEHTYAPSLTASQAGLLEMSFHHLRIDRFSVVRYSRLPRPLPGKIRPAVKHICEANLVERSAVRQVSQISERDGLDIKRC
jgi:hypothetical protein